MDPSVDAVPFRRHLPAILVLLGVTLIRAALMYSYELHVDEAYYWEWSRHAAPAYYDQGPGVAAAIALGTALFGHTAFGVRFGALICGLVVAALAYFLAFRLFRSVSAGLFTLAFFHLTPLNSLGSVLMMHDSVMYLAWAVLIAAFFRYRDTQRSAWLYVSAVAMAVGLLSKHTMILLAPPLLLFLLCYREDRRLFANPHAWAALLLAVVLCLPLLLWNYAHDFAGVYAIVHLPTADPRGRGWQETLSGFLLTQAFILSPVIFLLLLGVALREGVRRNQRPALRFLAWTTIFVFGFFLFMSFRKSVSGNWAVCGYFGATLLLGGQAAAWWRGRSKWIPALALGTGAALVILGLWPSAMLALGYALGVQQVSLEALPALRLSGGREMAAALDQVRAEHPGSLPGFNEYQPASLMAFYLPDQPKVYVFNVESRVNQYDFWPSPNHLIGKDFVFLQFSHREPREGVQKLFASVDVYPPATVERLGVPLIPYRIAVLKGFKGLPPQNRFQEARAKREAGQN